MYFLSGRAIQQIENALIQAQSVSARIAVLDVMGNSGRAEFLPSLESIISSEAASNVKSRAVYALRFVKNSAAAQDLVNSLGSGDISIRTAAAGAIELAEWNEIFRAPLQRCSSSDPVSRIQDSCRKALSDNTQVANSQ